MGGIGSWLFERTIHDNPPLIDKHEPPEILAEILCTLNAPHQTYSIHDIMPRERNNTEPIKQNIHYLTFTTSQQRPHSPRHQLNYPRLHAPPTIETQLTKDHVPSLLPPPPQPPARPHPPLHPPPHPKHNPTPPRLERQQRRRPHHQQQRPAGRALGRGQSGQARPRHGRQAEQRRERARLAAR